MILQALHHAGRLDISSQESLQGEEEVFRLTLKPGQIVEIKDHWRYLKNIDSAINSGLLKVISYNYSHKGEEVTHAELDKTVAGLLNIITGSGTAEINVYPVESADGTNKTWTLPSGQRFVSGQIALILNGQTLPPADFIEAANRRSITLRSDIPAPRPGETVTLTYLKEASYDQNLMLLQVDTTKAGNDSNTFILPTTGTGYDYYVNWGDGGAVTHIVSNGPQTHVYAIPGTYTIQVSGSFPRIYFNNGGDRQKVISWSPGNIAYTSLQSAFYGCSNLTTVFGYGVENMSAVTSANSAFKSCSNLVLADMSSWDLSNCTDMASMFMNDTSFNSPVLFNTGGATSMRSIFHGCTSFNQPLILDTVSVTDMTYMFYGCAQFNNTLTFSDTSNVELFTGMFLGCSTFNKPVTFDTGAATDMTQMFYRCTAFNQSVSGLNTSSVVSMQYMFYQCSSLNQSVVSFDTGSVTTMAHMFEGCASFKRDLYYFDISSLTDATDMLLGTDINEIGSTLRYDELLRYWDAQAELAGVPFNAGDAEYSCFGAEARTGLISNGWTIADGGLTPVPCGGNALFDLPENSGLVAVISYI